MKDKRNLSRGKESYGLGIISQKSKKVGKIKESLINRLCKGNSMSYQFYEFMRDVHKLFRIRFYHLNITSKISNCSSLFSDISVSQKDIEVLVEILLMYEKKEHVCGSRGNFSTVKAIRFSTQ